MSESLQRIVCEKYGARYCPIDPASKMGVAENVKSGLLPINGLRHPPTLDTNGWYLWAGEEFSTDPDFFKPLHAHHVFEWSPSVERMLALPPGFRFLIAPEYEDVWFDESLLEV